MELECKIGFASMDGLPVIAIAGTSIAVIGKVEECNQLLDYVKRENEADYTVMGQRILLVDGLERGAWDVVYAFCADLLTYKMPKTLLLIRNFPALVIAGENEWEHLRRVLREHLYKIRDAIIIASLPEEYGETGKNLSKYFYGTILCRSEGERLGIRFPPRSKYLWTPDKIFIETEDV